MTIRSILDFNTEYKEHQLFGNKMDCKRILGFQIKEEHLTFKKTTSIDSHLADFFSDSPILDRECTNQLILKYNLLKKRLKKLQSLIVAHGDERLNTLGLKYIEEITSIKKTLVDSNIRLAYIASKKLYINTNEYLSIAYTVLHRSVDLFDVQFGFAFSTYATQSIYRNIAKAAFQDPKEIRTKNIDSQFDMYEDKCSDPKDNIDNVDLKDCLIEYMSFLTPKERVIINAFYGIDRDRMTLTEIGRDMKISKEYVRQTREKALMKLRTLMKEDTVIGDPCM